MVRIHFIVSQDLQARFDDVAAAHGSRAALLRRLMAEAVQQPALASITTKGLVGRVSLRLTVDELRSLDGEAARMGLTQRGWVTALIRRRLNRRPTLDRDDQMSLNAIQSDLRRVAANVNQIARAVDLAVSQGAPLPIEVRYFQDLKIEMRSHVAKLWKALEGNLAYWDVEA